MHRVFDVTCGILLAVIILFFFLWLCAAVGAAINKRRKVEIKKDLEHPPPENLNP